MRRRAPPCTRTATLRTRPARGHEGPHHGHHAPVHPVKRLIIHPHPPPSRGTPLSCIRVCPLRPPQAGAGGVAASAASAQPRLAASSLGPSHTLPLDRGQTPVRSRPPLSRAGAGDESVGGQRCARSVSFGLTPPTRLNASAPTHSARRRVSSARPRGASPRCEWTPRTPSPPPAHGGGRGRPRIPSPPRRLH